MPFQAAFQLEGQQDLRHGGGGHLASAYQFVNRSGYRSQSAEYHCSLYVVGFLYRFLKRLRRGLRQTEHTYNIVCVAYQNGPIPDKAI